ncbi:protein-disulfide reductase DsbD [Chitinimonas sp. BJB300]|uniref:protein-disulfide reductase DsbD n=1 Tax=Chitinimonas sp. BJB300 TaxID=1559339 RepID=UPI000C0D6B66|nr:protein-disulfide reductase DsbD [Chitinimonas sp. BJB300]PHV13207.1 hypothetical protein CSQ89_01440 [Chitinimonas sp. BJB300]TSJ89598.1 protein-disulfide reductase DsbD [Chitinimonas sp. BJB300]
MHRPDPTSAAYDRRLPIVAKVPGLHEGKGMKRFVHFLLVGFLTSYALGATTDELLPGDQAFKPSLAKTGEKTATLKFRIAEGYYLYRDRIKFTLLPDGDVKGELPPGKKKHDEYFGEVETYRHVLEVPLNTDKPWPANAKLKLVSQGCADAGVCYPPETVELSLAGGGAASEPDVLDKLFGAPNEATTPTRQVPAVHAVAPVSAPKLTPAPVASPSESLPAEPVTSPEPIAPPSPTVVEAFEQTARPLAATAIPVQGPFAGLDGWALLLAFYLAGLGMAATVCMYPLIPIISSLIVGQGQQVGKWRGFTLAMAYVQGIAVVYAAVGAVAALTGSFLVATLQNLWVIAALALVFVFLALSMFGLFNLQLPSALQSRVNDASNRLGGGRLASVFLMGALSSLIVGACMGPPLAAGLGVVGARADVLFGMLAFYLLALGVGTPLLVVGVLGGHALPKAGAWMTGVKNVFGTLLLAVALWIARPVLPEWAFMLGWAALAIGAGVGLSAFDSLSPHVKPITRLGKALGVLLALVGMAQLVGLLGGARDPLQPLKPFVGGVAVAAEHKLAFQPVNSMAELNAAVAAAKGKTVLLDFYADWCVSCQEMERYTFADAAVQRSLANFVLLKADVTANTPEHKALLKRFGLFGPPGTIFFGAKGEEIGQRLIGFEEADRFVQRLNSVSPRVQP